MKAVLFDMDGTLFNSLKDIVSALNKMLKTENLPPVTESQMEKYLGYGAKRLVIDAINVSAGDKQKADKLGEQRINELTAFYSASYKSNCADKTTLYDGIKDAVISLKERGIKVAILTNKPQPTTDEMIKKYFGNGVFDAVVGQNGDKKCKPDKTEALRILSALGVECQNAVMVGDAETDYLTSVNAGIHHVCVLWGYRTKTQLQQAGATVFANDSKELLSKLLQILG